MKKFLVYASVLLSLGGMSSCSEDDNKPQAVETVSGFYTINGGNKRGNVPASITAYDYSTGKVSQEAFYAENNIRIGDGAQKAIVYGSKMYIAMYSSNLIWVVNPETLKIITSITPEGDATLPRALAAKDGKVYISMYTGYVSCVDTLTLQVEKTIKVGPNPDQIAIAGNKLVVANSDGQNSKGQATGGVKYGNSYISVVDLSTWTETKIQDLKKVLNPTDVASNGTDAFVICKGDYEGNPSVVVKVTGNDVTKVCEGTLMACHNDELYVANAPYFSKDVPSGKYTYKVYSTKTLDVVREDMIQRQEGHDSWIASPNGVAIDPVSGDIVILSYFLDSAGSSLVREPMYANIYDNKGVFKKRIDCGVGARAVTFIHHVVNK